MSCNADEEAALIHDGSVQYAPSDAARTLKEYFLQFAVLAQQQSAPPT